MDNVVKVTTLVSNILVVGIFAMLFIALDPFPAEPEPVTDESSERSKQQMDADRDALIAIWASQGLSNVNEIIDSGTAAVESSDDVATLTDIAQKANKAANFLGYIQEEYAEEYRDNYEYEFVRKALTPAHDAYVGKGNELKTIRNEAYFKLGELSEQSGDLGGAFFYYRDAYRLTSFDTGEENLRYRAEVKMKELLGIDDIESYITW